MHDIFLSYSKVDKAYAQVIASALEREGYDVWWDVEITSQIPFDTQIEQVIDKCKCVIVLWSSTSVKSEWVRNEAAEGKKRNVLIPVRIEDVTVPLAFRRRQYIDLIGWDSNNKDVSGFNELFKNINTIIKEGPILNVPKVGNTRKRKKSKIKFLPNIVLILILLLSYPAYLIYDNYEKQRRTVQRKQIDSLNSLKLKYDDSIHRHDSELRMHEIDWDSLKARVANSINKDEYIGEIAKFHHKIKMSIRKYNLSTDVYLDGFGPVDLRHAVWLKDEIYTVLRDFLHQEAIIEIPIPNLKGVKSYGFNDSSEKEKIEAGNLFCCDEKNFCLHLLKDEMTKEQIYPNIRGVTAELSAQFLKKLSSIDMKHIDWPDSTSPSIKYSSYNDILDMIYESERIPHIDATRGLLQQMSKADFLNLMSKARQYSFFHESMSKAGDTLNNQDDVLILITEVISNSYVRVRFTIGNFCSSEGKN